MKIRELYVKIDEARFYFPWHIQQLLSEIHTASEAFLQHLGERGQINIDDETKWRACADMLTADQEKLRAFYAVLPQQFESALAFKQLTTDH